MQDIQAHLRSLPMSAQKVRLVVDLVRGKEANEALEMQPELVNHSPFEDGWFFKLEDVDPAELDGLMDAAAYANYVAAADA